MSDSAEPLRRFYNRVEVVDAGDGLCGVALDGRALRIPSRAPIAVSRPVAQAMADEWEAQEGIIRPLTMPMTRLVNTAIDGVAKARVEVAAQIAEIAGTDLVLYRAEEPVGLVTRQKEEWDGVVAFAREALGVPLVLAGGIMPVRQDEALGPAVLAALPDEPVALAAMHELATLMGSAFLALAVHARHLTLEAAWRAAHVDENWNIAEWGEDAEAAARRAARWRDARAAALALGIETAP